MGFRDIIMDEIMGRDESTYEFERRNNTQGELKKLWNEYIEAQKLADKLKAEWDKKNKECLSDREILKEFSRR